jgi:exodeoxyribonuclease VII large subunit
MVEQRQQETESARALTVTELTRQIKASLMRAFNAVQVEGEISNLSCPASGHLYFTIKDEGAQISAVMFRGSQRTLTFTPRNGVVVRAHGEITVYEKRGNYQILVRNMEEGGKGSLQARFEALKKQLKEEGLFAAERKQALPILPQHVGVVTSATGAAIRDILNVITRRFPNLHLLLAPVKVQGDGAAEAIANAIDRLNEIGGLDVLIVGRGGGSLEDLWCFNEEVVARAVARSRIPVISAVGHEIDFTICDFVADLRAPTPSAAAELVVGCKDAFQERLAQLQQRQTAVMQRRLEIARHRLERAAKSYVFREPANAVSRHRQRLDIVKSQLDGALRNALQDRQQSLDWIGVRLQQCARAGVQRGRQVLQQASGDMGYSLKLKTQEGRQDIRRIEMQLKALNPLAVLGRGYSVTRLADGKLISTIDQITASDALVTQVSDGFILSTVTKTDHQKG